MDAFIILAIIIGVVLICASPALLVWVIILQSKHNKLARTVATMQEQLTKLSLGQTAVSNTVVEQPVAMAADKANAIPSVVPSWSAKGVEEPSTPPTSPTPPIPPPKLALEIGSNIVGAEVPSSSSSSSYTSTSTSTTASALVEHKAKVQVEEDNWLENLFLGNFFNKIGALAIIISLLIFAKLVTPYVLFTPELKVGASLLLGIVLSVVGGLLLKREHLGAFAEVLLGTGFATLFITVYCSCQLFSIVSPEAAFMVAVFFLLVIFALSMSLQRVSLLVLTMLAGYANLVVISPDVSSAFLICYLAFLNLFGLLGVYHCKCWRYLVSLNLAISLGITLAYFKAGHTTTPSLTLLIAVLWAMYAIYDWVRSQDYKELTVKESLFGYINFSCLSLACVGLWYERFTILGAVLLVLCLGYSLLVLYWWGRRGLFVRSYAHLLFLTGLAGSFFLLSGPWRVYLLSFEGLCLAIAAGWAHSLLQVKEKAEFAVDDLSNSLTPVAALSDLPVMLSRWSFFYLLLASFGILGISQLVLVTSFVLHSLGLARDSYIPGGLASCSLLVFGVPIVAWALAKLQVSHSAKASPTIEKYADYSSLFSISSLTLLYILVFLELQELVNGLSLFEHSIRGLIEYYSYIALGSLYALNTAILSRTREHWAFKAAAITSFVLMALNLCVSCLVLTDGHFIPLLNLRVLAFALAIATAYIYWRQRSKALFGVVIIVLGFSLVHAEAGNLALLCHLSSITTIAWILYAAAILVPGILKKQKYLSYSGIVIVVMSIVKIFLIDLAKLPGIYKLAVFFVLGVTLLVISFLYAQYQAKLKRLEQGREDKLYD